MSSSFGENIKVSVFGESHSPAIGVTVSGLPAGEKIDMDELKAFLERRAPGRNDLSTARKEADEPEFISGVRDGIIEGSPLTAVIRNKDVRSGDYDMIKDAPRPGHADFAAHMKYGGNEDYRGGGHFSGRLTAPVCIAGGIIKQILSRKGIEVNAKAVEIAGIDTTDESGMEKAFDAIRSAKEEGDSVGGIIECEITGIEPGVGGPMYDGVENVISKSVFAIPAIKGIEFGAGFRVARMKGSENNDEFTLASGKVTTKTNNAGGILGGITSGMPVVFRVAVKPTPSIAKEQSTVSYDGKEMKMKVKGRHDPCIALRAVPAVEAAAAIAVYDLLRGEDNE